ncbi:MAG: short-chain fatty acyl-CoA regulator family protein [Paracoccaceae bacterium]
MARQSLTGTRIRERRVLTGMKQADLARAAGISASYLNLIEHNRRRVGSGLLQALAGVLGVSVEMLTEGAEAALLADLRAAAQANEAEQPEIDRVEEFAGRFPGWARATAAMQRRLSAMERTVETLSDRMTHDPFLSASLHEVLSAVTAVRSTAGILAETEDIEPEWRARFHANLRDDSERLAEGAEALVAWLDGSVPDESGIAAPQEEVEAWLAECGYHIEEAETEAFDGGAGLIDAAPELASTAAHKLATQYLAQYRRDAQAIPLAALRRAVSEHGADPARLATRFQTGLMPVFRRLATLPDSGFGLVCCDGSGTLTFRKPADGFALPRFGAACPLWPLYRALLQPTVPIRAVVEMAGRVPQRFLAFAYCQPSYPDGFGGVPVVEAAMLILPAPPEPETPAARVGTSCRICPRMDCSARREPSILSEGF